MGLDRPSYVFGFSVLPVGGLADCCVGKPDCEVGFPLVLFSVEFPLTRLPLFCGPLFLGSWG